MGTDTSVDLDSARRAIYNQYPRGWYQEKTARLNSFSEQTGYDWRCIRSADCKESFGPIGHERCSNCLGMV